MSVGTSAILLNDILACARCVPRRLRRQVRVKGIQAIRVDWEDGPGGPSKPKRRPSRALAGQPKRRLGDDMQDVSELVLCDQEHSDDASADSDDSKTDSSTSQSIQSNDSSKESSNKSRSSSNSSNSKGRGEAIARPSPEETPGNAGEDDEGADTEAQPCARQSRTCNRFVASPLGLCRLATFW